LPPPRRERTSSSRTPASCSAPATSTGSRPGPVAAYLAGKLRFAAPGGLSFVDARDVATGLVALADRGRSGERTILAAAAGNLSWDRFFARVSAVSGVRRRTVSLPAWLATAGAAIARKPVSSDEVRAAARWWFYDGTKAERELGFQVRPLDETIADTIADRCCPAES